MTRFNIFPLKKKGIEVLPIKALKLPPILLSQTLPAKKAKLETSSLSSPPLYDSVEILGTGAADPSRVRAVSCALLGVVWSNRRRFIVLDCGGGSLGQLCRRFGSDVDQVRRRRPIPRILVMTPP